MANIDFKLCHECGGRMEPCTTSKSFRFCGKKCTLDDLNAFKCPNCGEVVYESWEIALIESFFNALRSSGMEVSRQ